MPHPDMHANNGHPDEGLLHEWLDDQLSPTNAADMQLHIASCAACGARVAEARGLMAASHRILSKLDDVPAGVIPASIDNGNASAISALSSGASNAEVVAASAAETEARSAHAAAAARSVDADAEARSAQTGAAARNAQTDAAARSAQADADEKRVVSIDTARKIPAAAAGKRLFNWKRAGSIAAVLLVAVTTARFFGANGDVVAPVASVASDLQKSAPVLSSPEKSADNGAVADRSDNEPKRSTAASTKAEQVASANTGALSKSPQASERPREIGTTGAAAPRPLGQLDKKFDKRSLVVAEAAARARTLNENRVMDTTGSLQAKERTDRAVAEDRTIRQSPPAANSSAAKTTVAVADASQATGGAGGGRGGRGGGSGAAGGAGDGGANAGPPRTSAANAATSGTVSNAPLPMANPPSASPPVVVSSTTLPRDSSALRAELEAALRSPSPVQAQARGTDTTGNASRLLLRAPGSRQSADAATAPAVRVAAFDSVTLMRTVCSPSCETTALHVNALGVVRYLVGSGNTQRVAMSQLTNAERAELQAIVLQSFSSAILQQGHTVCSSSPAGSDRKNFRDTAPELQLLIDFPGRAAVRPEQRCAKSDTELRQLGARVDAIAGTEALKRKVPPSQ
ncbi:MAG: zf-HC2 domain-containing protein [Gemmatimonas sp.]